MDPIVAAALIAAPGPIIVALIQLHQARKQREVAERVKETHHQVTTNTHKSAKPTVLDRLDDLGVAISEVQSWQERHDVQHQAERQLFYQGD